MTTTGIPQTPTPTSNASPGSRLKEGYWSGPTRHYDLLKEGAIALTVVSLLTVVLAALFSSPDVAAVSLQQWAQARPDDFIATTVHELAGDSTSAGYGAPYNEAGGDQSLGPISPQRLAGVTHPVDPVNDFVVSPLSMQKDNGPLQGALKQWTTADPSQQATWTKNYLDAIDKAGSYDKVETGDFGPAPQIAKAELTLALSGGLDSAMPAQSPFYPVNTTRAMLFLADGSYLDDLAGEQHLHGNTWGMMNTVGDFPGQTWLWLVSLIYQLPAFTTPDTFLAANADAVILTLVGVLSLGFAMVPFLPGIRSIPRWIPLYRIIWRDWYSRH